MDGIARQFGDLWYMLIESLAFDSDRLLEPEVVLRLVLQGLLLE